VNLVDEYSLGLGLFNATFGPVCGHPKVAWQIDPFGHSREHANLVALMGHESLFFARQHYLELAERAKQRELELVWTVSDELKTKILTGGFLRGTYAPPDGFCFDQLCQDEPIQDNPAFEVNIIYPLNCKFKCSPGLQCGSGGGTFPEHCQDGGGKSTPWARDDDNGRRFPGNQKMREVAPSLNFLPEKLPSKGISL
jgi:hypothetical protein